MDAPAQSLQLAERLRVRFPLLSDPGRKTIGDYKTRDPESNPFFAPNARYPNISKAAVFVIDGRGFIRWKYVAENLRDRPSTKAILDAVEAAQNNANGASREETN